MFIFSQTTKVSYLIGENLKALRRLPGASVSFFQHESALCQKEKKKGWADTGQSSLASSCLFIAFPPGNTWLGKKTALLKFHFHHFGGKTKHSQLQFPHL